MEASKRIKRSAEEQEDSELLPGIPHDITLCIVVPSLSWRDLRTLFSVSPIWQQEIQSRQVYDIRRRTESTEDLAVIRHYYPGGKSKLGRSEFGWVSDKDIQALSLYSARDKCCYDLPTIPFPGGIQIGSQFIALDGELYILGGQTLVGVSREVYVLDVAGQQREWKRCASMLEPRRDFGVGVLNGKIYVFGGASFGVGVLNGKIYVFGGASSAVKPVLACEVYDLKLSRWSSIAPMTAGRIYHNVAVIGEELLVYGGERISPTSLRHPSYFHAGVPIIYHPSKNEWRQMEPPDFTHASGDIFMAQGKFHTIHDTFMVEYNFDKGLWYFEQLCASIPSLGSSYTYKRTIALGDELLVLKYCHEGFGSQVGTRVCLYQSTGFGKDTKLGWEKANCSPNTFGELVF